MVSNRDMAALEDRVCAAVAAAVHDPVLKQPLAKLQWLHKRIAVVASETQLRDDNDDKNSTTTTLQMQLRLPSLLHPALPELKRLVQKEAESQVHAWLKEHGKQQQHALLLQEGRMNLDGIAVTVTAVATSAKPVPMMARLVDDHADLFASLGPGLASVAHFCAVYSCKVIYQMMYPIVVGVVCKIVCFGNLGREEVCSPVRLHCSD